MERDLVFDYRELAKQTIRQYAHFCADNHYEFDTYDNYRTVFYWIIGLVLQQDFVIDIENGTKYQDLKVEFIKDLKRTKLFTELKNYKSKFILFGVIKAFFDIVIKDLKESENNGM